MLRKASGDRVIGLDVREAKQNSFSVHDLLDRNIPCQSHQVDRVLQGRCSSAHACA